MLTEQEFADAKVARDAADIAYDDLFSGPLSSDPGNPSLAGYRVEEIFGIGHPRARAYALRNNAGDVVIAFRGSDQNAKGIG
ncbi:MAG: hypothetical protein IOD01_12695 [Rhodobacter sp.]|jgi:hypothetical protein|nr:hypothetical protein [Rhodobacter sp.]